MQGGLLYREDAFRHYDHAAKRAAGYGFTIDYNGLWYHHDGINPGPLRRVALAALFGGAGTGFMAGKGLTRDAEGEYWLAAPEGRYRVAVEDVPFVAVAYEYEGGALDVMTAFGEYVAVGPEHPLLPRAEPLRGDTVFYVDVRDGLLARLSRAVHMDLLARHAAADARGGYVIRSRGAAFAVPE